VSTEERIDPVQEEGVPKYVFEDEVVWIAWLFSPMSIAFSMRNKTDHSIRIVWNDAAFVDDTGESRRIIHSGVKYADRNGLQPPTVIVRRGSVTDFLLPSDNAFWVGGISSRGIATPGGWEHLPMLPVEQTGGQSETLKESAEKYVGKTFQVLLPLQIQDVVNDYIFIFRVNSVEVVVKSGTCPGTTYWNGVGCTSGPRLTR